MSHDETNIFSHRSAPSFLHKWSSSDDIRVGVPLKPGGSPSFLPPEFRNYHHRRRPPEDELTTLQQFLEAGLAARGPNSNACFFRDEITTFIDETPAPSPVGSPRHSRFAYTMQRERHHSLGDAEPEEGPDKDRRCSLTGDENLNFYSEVREPGKWTVAAEEAQNLGELNL